MATTSSEADDEVPKQNGQPVEQELDSKASDLDGNPFLEGDTPFYGGGQRLENLESLRHLVHFSNRILLVTGDQGSGKTFLLNSLCAHEQAALKLVRMQTELLQSSAALLQQMAAMLDLPTTKLRPPSDLLASIKESCEKRYANGFRTLFIIDDAQDLADDSLAMLLAFFGQEADSAFGLLLLAQPQIIERIRKLMAGSGKPPVHQIQLKNLSRDETIAYAEYYLVKFGWNKSVALTPELKKKLYEDGCGVPGRINRIASAMLVAGNESPKKFQLKPVYLFVSGIVVAMVVTLSLTISQYANIEGSEPANDKQTVRLNIPGPSASGSFATADSEPIAGRAGNDVGTGLVDGEAEIAGNTNDISAGLPFDDAADAETAVTPAAVKKETVASDFADDITAPQQTLDRSDVFAGDAIVKNSAGQQGYSGNQDRSGDQGTADDNGTEQSVAETGSLGGLDGSDLSVEQTDPGDYQRSLQWIAAQPQGSWTIQFLGGRSEETVIKFIRELDANSDYFYVKSSYQGKDWFVVLRGVYGSKGEARDALNSLPAEQRASGAWIRGLSGVAVR